MEPLNIALVTVGGVVLVVGLLSNLIRHSFISTPLIALLAGILLGPTAFGLLDPARWGSQEVILEQATRLTLAVSLMGVAFACRRSSPSAAGGRLRSCWG